MHMGESAGSGSGLLAVDRCSLGNNSALGNHDYRHSDLILELRKHAGCDSLICGKRAEWNSDKHIFGGFILIYVVDLMSRENEYSCKRFLLI